MELTDRPHDGRHDLHRARPGTDDADPAPGQFDGVIPAGAVERCAGERVETLDVGVAGMVQDAGGADHHIGLVGLAAGELDVPTGAVVAQPTDLGVELDEVAHAEACRHVLQVGEDLRPGSEGVRPVGVRCEREAVQVRGDVARDPRIGVVPPRAAQSVGLLVYDDRVEAGLLQLDRAEDAGHAGTDHDDP